MQNPGGIRRSEMVPRFRSVAAQIPSSQEGSSRLLVKQHQQESMRTTSLIPALVAVAVTLLAGVEASTSLTMAQNEACVLLVSFEVKTVNADASVLLYKPTIAYPRCGSLNHMHPDFVNIPSTTHMVVIYGGLLPADATYNFKDFNNIRVMGPEVLHESGKLALADLEHQAFRLDGTDYYYSGDSLYNITQPADDVEPFFPKLDVISHLRGQTDNIPSVVFANNDELLKSLPNPYREDVQASAAVGWSDPAWTVTHTLTLATATGTGLMAPAETQLERRQSFGRRRRS